MSSLKEIKVRIASINSTKKITSAMKMVSSAKLHHAQTAIENGLPYERKLRAILTHLLDAVPELDSPYTVQRPARRVAVVAFSSNSGLCGTFNANVERAFYQRLRTYEEQSVETLLFPVGKKIAESVTKQGYAAEGNFQHLLNRPAYEEVAKLADRLSGLFLSGRADRVELLYHHFKSAGSQVLVWDTWLPIPLGGATGDTGEGDSAGENGGSKDYSRTADNHSVGSSGETPLLSPGNYLLEPSPDRLLAELLPKVLRLNLYTVLLDTIASEHAARVLAMQTASENANDLLQELTLQYNKSRQQAITNELLDIMGGR